jgi:hypothetical protein
MRIINLMDPAANDIEAQLAEATYPCIAPPRHQ